MSEKKPRRAVGVPIGGIILVFLGIVFLLQTLNVLPWGLWGTLWRFWPVLIIIVGLNILLRRYNPWVVGVLVFILLGACLGIVICRYGLFPPASIATKSYAEPLDGVERAEVNIDFTAGSLTMSSLPSSSSNLVEANSEMSDSDGSMNVDFYKQNGKGELYLSTKRVNWRSWDGDGIGWVVRLTRNIPLAIDIKSSVSNTNLDLSGLGITEPRLDLDAGNCLVQMPSSVGITRAYINADASNLVVIIPEEVAAKVKVNVNLSVFDIDRSRFIKSGDYYMSRDFESMGNRIELEIDCGVGRVEVK